VWPRRDELKMDRFLIYEFAVLHLSAQIRTMTTVIWPNCVGDRDRALEHNRRSYVGVVEGPDF
jgi:hypothetical protein